MKSFGVLSFLFLISHSQFVFATTESLIIHSESVKVTGVGKDDAKVLAIYKIENSTDKSQTVAFGMVTKNNEKCWQVWNFQVWARSKKVKVLGTSSGQTISDVYDYGACPTESPFEPITKSTDALFSKSEKGFQWDLTFAPHEILELRLVYDVPSYSLFGDPEELGTFNRANARWLKESDVFWYWPSSDQVSKAEKIKSEILGSNRQEALSSERGALLTGFDRANAYSKQKSLWNRSTPETFSLWSESNWRFLGYKRPVATQGFKEGARIRKTNVEIVFPRDAYVHSLVVKPDGYSIGKNKITWELKDSSADQRFAIAQLLGDDSHLKLREDAEFSNWLKVKKLESKNFEFTNFDSELEYQRWKKIALTQNIDTDHIRRLIDALKKSTKSKKSVSDLDTLILRDLESMIAQKK